MEIRFWRDSSTLAHMPIKSIANRRLYRQIADQIIHLIETGEFGPGRRLPAERILAVELGVSRPSVREALIALEVEGWIDICGGAGVFVLERKEAQTPDVSVTISNLPLPGPIEVLYARNLIEPEMAALAARNASPEFLAGMSRALSDMVSCLASDPKHVEYDHCFHYNLAEATGNGALVRSMEALWVMRVNPLYPRLQDDFHNEVVWQRAIIEHREILEAVKRGDANDARVAMHRHLRNARKRFVSNWQNT
jgi:DNA-binding FadR family transcriptional regulator